MTTRSTDGDIYTLSPQISQDVLQHTWPSTIIFLVTKSKYSRNKCLSCSNSNTQTVSHMTFSVIPQTSLKHSPALLYTIFEVCKDELNVSDPLIDHREVSSQVRYTGQGFITFSQFWDQTSQKTLTQARFWDQTSQKTLTQLSTDILQEFDKEAEGTRLI